MGEPFPKLSRPETTRLLSRSVERHINPNRDPRVYMAREVTFDYYSAHPIRVDYMRFKPINNSVSGIEHGDFYCYEVKSSVEDFNSKNGHNMIGDYNYYVMPLEVYEAVKDKIPWSIGVLVPDYACSVGDYWYLKSVHNAKRATRERPITTMLFMMWRSYMRDVRKEDELEVEHQDL